MANNRKSNRCYVNNPRSGAKIPSELTPKNTLFYPERAMTTYQCHTSTVPRDFHIMTDCPDLVAMYDRESVFMWDAKRKTWVHPDMQTYGAAIEIIRHMCFGITASIPRYVIDGKVTNCMGHPVVYDQDAVGDR